MYNPFKSPFVVRHYRTIISSLVLLNTALIFFLIVYIWSYGPGSGALDEPDGGRVFPSGETVRHAVVVGSGQNLWSKPGGGEAGAASQGVLERGQEVEIVDSTKSEADGALWYKLAWDGREGWAPAQAVRFIHTAR